MKRLFLNQLLLTGSLAVAAQAQNFSTLTEWSIPTPNSFPGQVLASGTSGAYFSELSSGKIGFLDMKRNTITEWTLPAGSSPYGLAADGGNLAFADQGSHVAILDPGTSTLKTWTIPSFNSAPRVLEVAVEGKLIFFSDFNQNLVGMVDTSNNQVTMWTMPGSRSPRGITIAGKASGVEVWTADTTAFVSRLNPATNTFTEWQAGSEPLEIAMEANGNVLISDFFNQVFELNPISNIVDAWHLPTPDSEPDNLVAYAPGIAAFAEFQTGRVATLNMTAPTNFHGAITPFTTVVAPITEVVQPQTITLPETISPATSVSSGDSRIVTGGFTEYPACCGNVGIATTSKGALLFTMGFTNRIGMLQ